MEISDLLLAAFVLVVFWIPGLAVFFVSRKAVRARKTSLLGPVIALVYSLGAVAVSLFILVMFMEASGLAGYTPRAQEILLGFCAYSPLVVAVVSLICSFRWLFAARSASAALLLLALAFPWNAHAEALWWGGGGSFAFLMGYLLFLGVSGVVSVVGIIRAVLRRRRGEKTAKGIGLSLLFAVPNVLTLLIVILADRVTDGLMSGRSLAFVCVFLLLPVFWFIAALTANR